MKSKSKDEQDLPMDDFELHNPELQQVRVFVAHGLSLEMDATRGCRLHSRTCDPLTKTKPFADATRR